MNFAIDLRPASPATKVATTVGTFRVPDNYGHRLAGLRLRSFSLQNHRSERLTKGSETAALSVPDLGAIKSISFFILNKAVPIPLTVFAADQIFIDQKLNEGSNTVVLTSR
ncbi:hypothetical protein KM043_009845 [Ampulex compressa]|nr:hypothetical protein KM043_009845 [Ampulex compressa]